MQSLILFGKRLQGSGPPAASYRARRPPYKWLWTSNIQVPRRISQNNLLLILVKSVNSLTKKTLLCIKGGTKEANTHRKYHQRCYAWVKSVVSALKLSMHWNISSPTPAYNQTTYCPTKVFALSLPLYVCVCVRVCVCMCCQCVCVCMYGYICVYVCVFIVCIRVCMSL